MTPLIITNRRILRKMVESRYRKVYYVKKEEPQIKEEPSKQEQSFKREEPTKPPKKITRVVNVRAYHLRPKYRNLHEWCKDAENNVYIGREVWAEDPKDRIPGSIWQNKFKIGPNYTREDVVRLYEEDIRKRLKEDKSLVPKLLELKGKNLGCWCAPESCHGHVLQKLIKEYDQEAD